MPVPFGRPGSALVVRRWLDPLLLELVDEPIDHGLLLVPSQAPLVALIGPNPATTANPLRSLHPFTLSASGQGSPGPVMVVVGPELWHMDPGQVLGQVEVEAPVWSARGRIGDHQGSLLCGPDKQSNRIRTAPTSAC